MNMHTLIVKDFLSISHIKQWPELQILFRRVASLEPGHWLLPLRACEAVGGTSTQALPVLLTIACSHLGIVMVDDMLDSDPRGEYLHVGEPAAANMACALQAAALVSLERCEMHPESKLAALKSINEMFLSTTLGQYWDVQSAEQDEAAYWRITRAKSSPFFGEAFHLGALIGGASVHLAGKVKELGRLYGEMIQIHDDLHDTMAVPANPDWTEGRSPLPILFAQLVDHPAQARFAKLRPKAGGDPKALKEAQEILVQCGAVSYCIDQLLTRYQTVRNILAAEALARPSELIRLFEDIVAPVWKLFQAAGESPFE
jgi:geranylgeranyl pyrophosphate synthase